jgi:hypothetical protein
MNNRYFWGTPHTDTDVNAFEAAARGRIHDIAAGAFAAVAAVDRAIEQITRRSSALLQFDLILAATALFVTYRLAPVPDAAFLQLNRWSLGLALISCLLLLPNLALLWADGKTHANPREAYLLSMGVHKTRAARFTIALVLSFVAIFLMLLSATRLG